MTNPTDIQELHTRERNREEQAAHEQQLTVDSVKFIMESKLGRRFVARLLDSAGVDRVSFTGDNQTFFNEGKRTVGLEVQAAVRALCPEHYVLMLQEQNQNAS